MGPYSTHGQSANYTRSLIISLAFLAVAAVAHPTLDPPLGWDAAAVIEHFEMTPPAVLVSFDPQPPAADRYGIDPAWFGLIECESGWQPTIENSKSTASGLFQFLDTTWRWVTEDMGRFDLAAGRAKDASIADQYAAAVHLRDMPGGGISHWVCGYRYG